MVSILSKVLCETDVTLTFQTPFELERGYDFLKFDDVTLSTRPTNGLKEVSAGTVMTFTSDHSVQNAGFKFCASRSKFSYAHYELLLE